MLLGREGVEQGVQLGRARSGLPAVRRAMMAAARGKADQLALIDGSDVDGRAGGDDSGSFLEVRQADGAPAPAQEEMRLIGGIAQIGEGGLVRAVYSACSRVISSGQSSVVSAKKEIGAN